jgi:hypothetical protein
MPQFWVAPARRCGNSQPLHPRTKVVGLDYSAASVAVALETAKAEILLFLKVLSSRPFPSSRFTGGFSPVSGDQMKCGPKQGPTFGNGRQIWATDMGPPAGSCSFSWTYSITILYGTGVLDTLTCGPTIAPIGRGAALTSALPAKVFWLRRMGCARTNELSKVVALPRHGLATYLRRWASSHTRGLTIARACQLW